MNSNIVKLSNLLKEKGLTIGSVESLTGGLFASEMTSVPGASKIFKGAFVTYFTEEKIRLLDIPRKVVDDFGVVSFQVADLMCRAGLIKLDTDIAVSFTGNAGPDVMENKPCGKVFIGFNIKGKITIKEYDFKGSREEIRLSCINEAACELINLIS